MEQWLNIIALAVTLDNLYNDDDPQDQYHFGWCIDML